MSIKIICETLISQSWSTFLSMSNTDRGDHLFGTTIDTRVDVTKIVIFHTAGLLTGIREVQLVESNVHFMAVHCTVLEITGISET